MIEILPHATSATEVATAFYRSPIGIVRVDGTARAVRSVTFVDAIETDVFEPPKMVARCIIELEEYFAGVRKKFTVRMQQEGTEFQQKVWSELKHIAYGKTVSYTDIARKVGSVRSVRAVGGASSKNHLCIIIPCHRVIGSDGDLVGYAGGLLRKKWLLGHEARYYDEVLSLF